MKKGGNFNPDVPDREKKRRWAPGWQMTLFVACMLPVVVALGFWQLERREEKLAYEARYFDRVGMLPVAPAEATEDLGFQRLRIKGRFEGDNTFLVDNQLYQGRPGYWVVTSFAADNGDRWLVNRGWVSAPEYREQLPEVQTPTDSVELVAVAWPDTGLLPLLAEDTWPESWPKRVQRFDVAEMARLLVDVKPVELRLEAGQPGGFVPASLDADFQSSRHLGYAVQWFGLGLALITGFVIYGFKRNG